MKHVIRTLFIAAAVALVGSGGAAAQQAPQPAPVPPPSRVQAPVLLKVEFVISHYQGDKKVSSYPYTMTVRANEAKTNLRMGSQVPIPSYGPENKMIVVYKEVGTNIDCGAQILDDGRFRLDLSIEDSSLEGNAQGVEAVAKGVPPQIRSFRLTNETVVLKDGQTALLTTATEKLSGEIAKVDVTLNVVK